ncbi:HAD family hydrolase [Noviherbaspirillum saxi]|uniref:HAD family hydrolase n=1 Tax=Noviherbaspirillum saxi TaxID=2320863 RepID=A0A3A3FP41_9BURK|nr:HAD family hydrolase [Noviherbaspirillum saxi]
MKYQLLVFDFDGTLADSFGFFIGVFDQLADRHGFRRIADEDIDRLRGYDARQIIRHVGIPLWKVPGVAKDFKAMMSKEIARVSLFDGISELLQALVAQGVHLAVLTSNSEENVRAVLGPSNAALFSRFECGATLFGKRGKLRRLVADSRVPRSRILCIGDETRDADAAFAEGIAFGAVAWGYTQLDTLKAKCPDLVFASVDDIPHQLGLRRDSV